MKYTWKELKTLGLVVLCLIISTGCKQSMTEVTGSTLDCEGKIKKVIEVQFDANESLEAVDDMENFTHINSHKINKEKEVKFSEPIIQVKEDDVIVIGIKDSEYEGSNFNIDFGATEIDVKNSIKDILEDSLVAIYEEEFIELSFEIFNQSSKDAVLTFDLGEKFDYWIYNNRNQEVYRLSSQFHDTIPAIGDEIIKPNEKLIFSHKWNLRDNDGELISDGIYTIVFVSSFEYNGYRERLEHQIKFVLTEGKVVID